MHQKQEMKSNRIAKSRVQLQPKSKKKQQQTHTVKSIEDIKLIYGYGNLIKKIIFRESKVRPLGIVWVDLLIDNILHLLILL